MRRTDDTRRPVAPVTSGSDSEPERREVVLVVDDEPTVRSVCCAALEASGYRTIPAGDGAEAVELFTRADPKISLILTDLSMPKMDGPTAIRSIRRLSREVPIIAMSGLADRFRAEGIEEHGIIAILEKPFAVEDMLRMLGEALAPFKRD